MTKKQPKIKIKNGQQKNGAFFCRGIEINPRILRTCHDENCPKCNFPETIIVREEKTMKPLWIECSKRNCNWGRKIIPALDKK